MNNKALMGFLVTTAAVLAGLYINKMMNDEDGGKASQSFRGRR